MARTHLPHHRDRHREHHQHRYGRLHGFAQRWFLTNSIVAGIFALVWLILRSGSKPSRFAYPCQQVAMSAASLALGVPVVSAVISATRRLAVALRTPPGITVAALGLVCTSGLCICFTRSGTQAGGYEPLPLAGPTAFSVEHRGSARERGGLSRVAIAHHPGAHDGSSGRDNVHLIDDAVKMMVDEAVKAFAGTSTIVEAWEQIIPDPEKKVAIKINCQIEGIFTKAKVVWPIVDGLIARGVPLENILVYDRTDNAFSYAGFVRDPDGAGLRVGILQGYDFGGYSAHADQYYIAKMLIGEAGEYDCDYLINVPVCKALDGYSGVTLSMKNHYGTCSPNHGDAEGSIHEHICMRNALPAIRDKTRLVVLDACYCEYKWYNGRDQTWVDVVDKIIVSDDPVAVDYHGWQIIEELRSAHDFPPCSPYPYAIDYAADVYGLGTNDPDQMEIIELELPRFGDSDRDGDVDLADFAVFAPCMTGPDGGLLPGCTIFDFGQDGDSDAEDFAEFQAVFTGPAVDGR